MTIRTLVLIAWTLVAAVGCGDEQVVENGAPVPLEDWLRDCTPSTTRCVGPDLAICPSTGGTARLAECDGGAACDPLAPGRPACSFDACAAAGAACIDESVVGRCDAAGARRVHEACAPGTSCVDGACAPLPVCEVGAAACDGTVRMVCDGDAMRAVEDCARECTSDDGCGCADGACFDRICAAGAGRCVDGAPERCSGNGSEWQPRAACDAGTVCVDGACETVACPVPGRAHCVGDTRVACDGGAPQVEDCRASDRRCVESGGEASCSTSECVPGAATCIDGARFVCAESGDRRVSDPCPVWMDCDGGACVGRLCEVTGALTCIGETVLTHPLISPPSAHRA